MCNSPKLWKCDAHKQANNQARTHSSECWVCSGLIKETTVESWCHLYLKPVADLKIGQVTT